jgi:DNA-binding CsgD family transcriptional regulator
VTERTPKDEGGSRSDVDTASVGLLTIDTGSQAITSCNDAFAELVGCPAADVIGRLITEFVDDDAKPVATAVIEGIQAGFISSVGGNVNLFRDPRSVGVDCWILALGTALPRRTAMAGAVPTNGAADSEPEPSELGLRPTSIDLNRVVIATLDDQRRIVEMAAGSATRLGFPEPDPETVMPRLHELVHPADVSLLDGPFGPASSRESPGTSTLRLRGPDDKWLSARVTVSPLRGSVPARFGLVVVLKPNEEPDETESERLARLEEQLARIRQVVQSTDKHGATDAVDLSDLTTRQREIVERLLDGYRVDAIARFLYVSPSTIRNHLSAIFEKLGVASQSELVELLRGHVTSPGADVDQGAVEEPRK